MNKIFTEKDHVFIRQKAREVDASKPETRRKKALIEYSQQKVEQKRQKDKAKADKKAEKQAKLAAVTLIFDKESIKNLKGQKLQDQYDAFALAGAPLPATKPKLVDDKRKALQAAVDLYNDGTWQYTSSSDGETSSLEPGLDTVYEEDEEDS